MELNFVASVQELEACINLNKEGLVSKTEHLLSNSLNSSVYQFIIDNNEFTEDEIKYIVASVLNSKEVQEYNKQITIIFDFKQDWPIKINIINKTNLKTNKHESTNPHGKILKFHICISAAKGHGVRDIEIKRFFEDNTSDIKNIPLSKYTKLECDLTF